MTDVKCIRCGGTATGTSLDDAKEKLDHAVGLSRGIKCGESYGKIKEIKSEKPQENKPKVKSESTPKHETKKEETKPQESKKSNFFKK